MGRCLLGLVTIKLIELTLLVSCMYFMNVCMFVCKYVCMYRRRTLSSLVHVYDNTLDNNHGSDFQWRRSARCRLKNIHWLIHSQSSS